jgi:predicted phosphodiesterase
MRYALLSDIHGNRPALEAVLRDIATRDVHAIHHLGDLVGYGPWPNETVDLIRERAITGVAGNYDTTVATGYKHCGCKYEDARQEELSHASYLWTRQHVSAVTTAFLGSLPFRIDLRPSGGHVSGPTVILIHGNHALNTVYVHEQRSDAFLSAMGGSLGARAGDVVCFGHTHVAWERTVDGIRYINTGSVGRPKDGDWRAGYVVLDVTEKNVTVDFVRVSYDVDAIVNAIRASDLPHEFAEQLRAGRTSAMTVQAGANRVEHELDE